MSHRSKLFIFLYFFMAPIGYYTIFVLYPVGEIKFFHIVFSLFSISLVCFLDFIHKKRGANVKDGFYVNFANFLYIIYSSYIVLSEPKSLFIGLLLFSFIYFFYLFLFDRSGF